MSRLDKLVAEIKKSPLQKLEEKYTDRAFKEAKLESHLDMLGVRLAVHTLVESLLVDTSIDQLESILEEILEDVTLPQLVLPLLPAALNRLGEIMEGVDLEEADIKELEDSLALIL